ncbi:hypothetical protein JD844_017720, partial [Phrynosoma platyrhinos]
FSVFSTRTLGSYGFLNACRPPDKAGKGHHLDPHRNLGTDFSLGEERIQRELNENHRNHDIYAEISGKLMEKGISRSVKEIRNKCKTLTSEYNKVNNHNKISGNAPATCPFFTEMDRFLHMDRSLFPKRITKSLHIVRKPTGGPSLENTSQPPQASQHQDASTTAVATVEVPLAISEEGNIILHLVPVEQPLASDPHPPEDMDPQDLPSSPAASDGRIFSDGEKHKKGNAAL